MGITEFYHKHPAMTGAIVIGGVFVVLYIFGFFGGGGGGGGSDAQAYYTAMADVQKSGNQVQLATIQANAALAIAQVSEKGQEALYSAQIHASDNDLQKSEYHDYAEYSTQQWHDYYDYLKKYVEGYWSNKNNEYTNWIDFLKQQQKSSS